MEDTFRFDIEFFSELKFSKAGAVGDILGCLFDVDNPRLHIFEKWPAYVFSINYCTNMGKLYLFPKQFY